MKKFLKEYFLWLKLNARKLIWTYALFNLLVGAPLMLGVAYVGSRIEKIRSFHNEQKAPAYIQCQIKLEKNIDYTYTLMADKVKFGELSEEWKNEKLKSDRNFDLCNERLDEMLADPNYNQKEKK